MAETPDDDNDTSPISKSPESTEPPESTKPKAEILPPDALQRLQEFGVDTSDPERVVELVSIVNMSRFQGPIPPAEILAGYDKLRPGTAAQIIGWAETQMSHRHELESRQTIGDEKRMDRDSATP